VRSLSASATAATWSSSWTVQGVPTAPPPMPIGDWKSPPAAEVRVRGEYRRDLDAADRGLLVERARLGADATGGALEARLVLQDARSWNLAAGDGALGATAPVAVTGAYEAWV